MRAKILIVGVIATWIAACNKDKFTTKPQLEFESFSTDVVVPGGQLIINLKYRDKEGDIQDSIYVERYALNCTDTLRYFHKIPANVPKIRNAEGELVIAYSYAPDNTYVQIGDPKCGLNDPPGGTKTNDTCIYRFALKDLAGNTSDTITTPPFVLVKR